MGVREATIDRSYEVREALDATELVDGLTAIGTRPAEGDAPVVTLTTRTWGLPPSDTGRWDGHGGLHTVALLTVDDTYGPARDRDDLAGLRDRPDQSAGLAGILNDASRQQWSAVGSVGMWVADSVQAGVAVRTVLPAAMCPTGDKGALTAMVTNIALYQAQQCSDLATMASGLLADHEGPDPYVTTTVPVEAVNPEQFGRPEPAEGSSGVAESPSRRVAESPSRRRRRERGDCQTA